jgi:hypothetical protein
MLAGFATFTTSADEGEMEFSTKNGFTYHISNDPGGVFTIFQPVDGFIEGQAYYIEIDIQAWGTQGWRVRLADGSGYPGALDADVVNNFPTLGADGVVSNIATEMPAWFPTIDRGSVNDIDITAAAVASNSTGTLVLDFVWTNRGIADATWLGLVGDWGGNDWEILDIRFGDDDEDEDEVVADVVDTDDIGWITVPDLNQQHGYGFYLWGNCDECYKDADFAFNLPSGVAYGDIAEVFVLFTGADNDVNVILQGATIGWWNQNTLSADDANAGVSLAVSLGADEENFKIVVRDGWNGAAGFAEFALLDAAGNVIPVTPFVPAAVCAYDCGDDDDDDIVDDDEDDMEFSTKNGFTYYISNDPGGVFAIFQPVGGFIEGQAYYIEIDIQAWGTQGWRVRLADGDGYPGAIDADVVNNFPTLGADGVVSNIATEMPAWFPTIDRGSVNDIDITAAAVASNNTGTLILDFVWTNRGIAEATWLGLVGDWGGNDWEILDIRFGGGNFEELLSTNQYETTSTTTAIVGGTEADTSPKVGVTLAVIPAIMAAAAVAVARRRK